MNAFSVKENPLDNLNDNDSEVEDPRDNENNEEEGDDEEGDDEEGDEGEDDESRGDEKSKKEEVKFEREAPPSERPPVNYEQAFNHFRQEAVVSVLKQNGFEVKNQAEIDEALNKLPNADFQKLQKYADKHAKNAADEYHKTQINPYIQWQHRERVKAAAFFVTREFPDIREYKPEMVEIEEAFFKRNPELVGEPEISIPMLLLKAKELRMKRGGKLPPKAKKSRREAPALETAGGNMSRKASQARPVEFGKFDRPLKALDGILKF